MSKRKSQFPKFVPDICPHCTQSTNYAMCLDKGTAAIVVALANAVAKKNQNCIHLLGEISIASPKAGGYDSYDAMLMDGMMTFRMVCNATRAVRHGLIYPVEDGSGNYLLTAKGAKFLRGEPIPRVAIVNKGTHSKEGYYYENEDRITIKDLMKRDEEFWVGEIAKLEKSEIFAHLQQDTLL